MAAQNRRKAPSRRKPRRWLIPKVLLVVACVVLIAFIGAIFVMERELRRIGLFGGGSSQSPSAVHSPSSPPSLGGKDVPQRAQSAPATSEELTPEERKQLDNILRSR